MKAYKEKLKPGELRRERNELLRVNGYRWQKTYADHDRSDEQGEWVLLDPEGQETNVDAALEKIYSQASIFPLKRGGMEKRPVAFSYKHIDLR